MNELVHGPWQAQLAMGAMALSLAVSVVTDLRRRLILNAVTLPALAVILVALFLLGGWALLAEAGLGLAVCTVPLLVAFKLRAMGAGDVKLMMLPGAVSGAAAGWPFSITVLLYVSIAGGVQALAWLLAAKLRGSGRPRHVPYGLAIAAGTAAAFWFGDRVV